MNIIEPTEYVRKPFFVKAMRVTAENMAQVAEWCNGVVSTAEVNDEPFVKVHVLQARNERQTRAFVGDWVLQAGKSYKVYTHKAFTKVYEPVDKENVVHPEPVSEDAEITALPVETKAALKVLAKNILDAAG
jgi:hypothetical protein